MYLGQGPNRSLTRVAAHFANPTPKRRQLQIWSSANEWVARARAYDTWRLEQEIEARGEVIERAKQSLVRRVQRAAVTLAKIALGEEDENSKNQVKALEAVLDRAGLISAKKVEVTGKDGGPIKTDVAQTVKIDFSDIDDGALEDLADEQNTPKK